MAGMPGKVVARAKKVLAHLEASHAGDLGGSPESGAVTTSNKVSGPALGREPQLSFFQLDDPALERIREELTALDINSLTPVEALFKLNEIKRLVEPSNARLRKA
jgi:DNA mismatch repair protein MutS